MWYDSDCVCVANNNFEFPSCVMLVYESDTLDLERLHSSLMSANAETLLAVTKRALATDQFLPQWFLNRYMEVDGSGCVRTLWGGGRVAEAGALCCHALRSALQTAAAPHAAPLALADTLLLELREHDHPLHKQIHDELELTVKKYAEVIMRTSNDMKLAKLNITVSNLH